MRALASSTVTLASLQTHHVLRRRSDDVSQASGPELQRLAHLGFVSVLVIDSLKALASVSDHHFGHHVGNPQRGKARPYRSPNVVNDPRRHCPKVFFHQSVQACLRFAETADRLLTEGCREQMLAFSESWK